MPKEILCLGCFVVDPKIRIINGVALTLEEIIIQTVLSPCLGPLGEWWERLKVTYECGFNSVHFTPYQVSYFTKTNNYLNNLKYTNLFPNIGKE